MPNVKKVRRTQRDLHDFSVKRDLLFFALTPPLNVHVVQKLRNKLN